MNTRFTSGTLNLPDGLGMAGYLSLHAANGENLCVCLTKTEARVIFAIQKAWANDEESLPIEIRGWRSAKRLAKAVAAQDRYLIEVMPSSIIHYICAINRAVRKAAREQGFDERDADSLKIIRTRDGWGYQLALPRLLIARP